MLLIWTVTRIGFVMSSGIIIISIATQSAVDLANL